MRTIPGLVAAALVFWGSQTDALALAAVLALVLEAPRVVGARWELTPPEQNRVADLTTVVFVGVAVYLGFTAGLTRAAILTLEWLPLTLAPLIAIQGWGTAGRISLTTVFWSRRKAQAAARAPDVGTVDLAPVYAAVCVLAGSVANHRTVIFYVGACLVAAYVLAGARTAAFSRAAWTVSLVLAAALGWAGHVGLHGLARVALAASRAPAANDGDGELGKAAADARRGLRVLCDRAGARRTRSRTPRGRAGHAVDRARRRHRRRGLATTARRAPLPASLRSARARSGRATRLAFRRGGVARDRRSEPAARYQSSD